MSIEDAIVELRRIREAMWKLPIHSDVIGLLASKTLIEAANSVSLVANDLEDRLRYRP